MTDIIGTVRGHISDMARFDLVIYGASGYTGPAGSVSSTLW